MPSNDLSRRLAFFARSRRTAAHHLRNIPGIKMRNTLVTMNRTVES